jgi:aspartate/methionine/tyrosine aminotransferase
MDKKTQFDLVEQRPLFSVHTREISSEGAEGWAIADAAAEAAGRGEDVVSLCLGDTSFDTPQRIVDAAISSLQTGRTHYAPVPGTPELRREIASAQGRSDGQNWSVDEVTVFAGAQNALFASLLCVAGPGDEVLYLEPWYATYEATIRVSGAVAKPVRLSMDRGSHKISKSSLAGAVSKRTRAILLNSPNNPGGYTLGLSDLKIIAEFAAENNLWIISDEVYRSAVFDGQFLSITSVDDARRRTIIVNSLSKSHAMTGWRVGWTVSPPAASGHLQNLAQCMLFGSPTFIQDAAAVALRSEGDAEMRLFAGELRKRRELMCGHLDGMSNLICERPAGGMFCFVDVSATGMTGTQFAENLYAEERLAIVPGSAFGPNMQHFVRISYSGSIEDIEEGMKRMKRFCEDK